MYRTAIHEAGHAVLGRLVGIVCGGVSIIADHEKMKAGFAVIGDQWETVDAWEKRGKYRGYQSAMCGRIICYMAGREAEIIAIGEQRGGDTDDLLQIDMMAEDAGVSRSYLERLRPKVRLLLRRHWRKVEAVANGLFQHKKLSAGKIDAIISKVTTQREKDVTKRIEASRQRYAKSLMQGVVELPSTPI